MEDVVMVDSPPALAPVQGSEQKVKRPLKRKRVSLILENMSVEERESQIEELRGEIESLVKYFKEVLGQKEHLKEVDAVSSSSNSLFACLIEERDLPYSKLVEEIYEKLKSRDGITLASVQSSVLSIGHRQMYGIGNADALVLEDDTEKCLWCWETRDLKHIPQIHRGVLSIRRICRKKIHERINAVSGMISALEMPLIHSDSKIGLLKASQNLAKVSNEAGIRQWMENMVQKNGTDMAEKEAKLKEKELMKELERKKREAEKEKRRSEKDKLQSEKELKRLQEEAEKEAKRREKEEAEMKKQLKRQQEEAEKEQRRREKEAADLRKQLALQKQATMMERLFKSKKSEPGTKVDPSPVKTLTLASSMERDDTPTAVTLPMDHALSLENALEAIDLCRSQFDDWIRLGRSTRAHRLRRWGMRQKPKTVLVKELKLQGSSSEVGDSAKVLSSDKGSGCHVELSIEKLVDGLEETVPDDKSCQNNGDCSQSGIRQCNRTKKLLQFDKSHRPAYYGTLSKKSDVIGPRHPFKMDPDLEYDIESDEEWEEEDPGESLSDCDKDEEEENLDEGNLRAEDEEGSEDGFFVPDGYLSENEGVQDSMEVDSIDGEARSSPGCKQEFENEEFRALLRQQKHIYNLTEHALKKNQPLIISNLMHEKSRLLTAEDLSGIPKLEQTFFQALSIRPFPGGPPLQISAENGREDDVQEVCPSERKSNPTHVAGLQDKDLPKIVQCIQSCPQGINKVVESLQQKFPTFPKSQLNRKVREISNFEDNRWQRPIALNDCNQFILKVKKEILDKLGLSVTPEKCARRTKSIATFFSKRCLPPSGETTMKMDETSPQPCRKSETLNKEHGCTKKLL